MKRSLTIWIGAGVIVFATVLVGAQQAGAPAAGERGRGGAQPPVRPPVFFDEGWKQLPSGEEHPVSQESVANASLELKLYGASAKEVQLAGNVKDNNVRLWNGLCSTPVVASLRDRKNYVDLTGLAKIRWQVRTSGFHAVRPAIKLADGTWLVGDHADTSPTDFNETEFSLASVRWLKLDIERVVTTGNWIDRPDLTKVDEVGFVDLMPGSGHGAGGWDNLGRFQVYGKPVPR